MILIAVLAIGQQQHGSFALKISMSTHNVEQELTILADKGGKMRRAVLLPLLALADCARFIWTIAHAPQVRNARNRPIGSKRTRGAHSGAHCLVGISGR